MTDSEKKVIVETLTTLMEVELPEIIEAEMAKIPDGFKPIVLSIWTVLKVPIIAFLDTKIKSL